MAPAYLLLKKGTKMFFLECYLKLVIDESTRNAEPCIGSCDPDPTSSVPRMEWILLEERSLQRLSFSNQPMRVCQVFCFHSVRSSGRCNKDCALIISFWHSRMCAMDQLLLALTTQPLFTFDNIVMHAGISTAVSTAQSVYRSADRPLPYLFVHGPHGTGKTHILNAVASLLRQRSDQPSNAVKVLSPLGDPPRFDDLEQMSRADEDDTCTNCGLVIDDLHFLDEGNTLHLWNLANRLTRWGAPLVMSSLYPPEEVFSNDPHLRSRVASGLVFPLEAPDDSARAMILDKMAKDRNIRLPQDVANYLVTRKARNVKELGQILAILDTESLRFKRRITLSFVKSIENEGLL